MINKLTKILLPVLGLTIAQLTSAQQQPIQFEAAPNGVVTVKGDLAAGEKMQDLSWAWNSQNACFVATQQQKFTGNHVLFQTGIPPRSEMTIKVIPDDKSADFSIYAYSGGRGMVPDLQGCVSCEADFKWDYKVRGKTQDHSRSVQLRAINNPFPVTIGVVGAQGLSSGGFTLEVSLIGGESATDKPQEQIPTYQAESRKGERLAYSGDLSQGVFMHDLSWASSSQNACFPATRQSDYRGHHQLYVTDLPAQSELTITLIPEDADTKLSLYAYSIGKTDVRLAPDLPSCVSCEASYQPMSGLPVSHRKVQLRAVTNPYQVVIGVAGADGVTAGKYQLQLELR